MSHLPMIFYSRTGTKPVNCVFMDSGGEAAQTFGTLTNSTLWVPSGSDTVLSDDTVFYGSAGRSIKIVGNDVGVPSVNSFPAYPSINSYGRFNFRVRFSTVTAGRIFFATLRGTSSDSKFYLVLSSTGKLQLWNGADPIPTGSDIQIGSDSSTTLSVNTWYRICVSYTWESSSVNQARVYINGNLEITISNDINFNNLGNTSSCLFSGIGSSSSNAMWIDDIYIDDSDDLTDVGEIRVTSKQPSSNNTNNFGAAIGNNPSNRYENVNERPASNSNGWQDTTSSGVENYGIQGASSGDLDISGYSGTYPSTLPASGVTNDYTQGFKLYESGVQVAISDTTNAIVAYMSWIKCSLDSGSPSSVQPLIWINGVATRAINTNNIDDTNINARWVVTTLITAPADRPMIFHSVADEQPFIFSSRD